MTNRAALLTGYLKFAEYLKYVNGGIQNCGQSSVAHISFCVDVEVLITHFNGREIYSNSGNEKAKAVLESYCQYI